jgi:hypothetical protein
LPIPADPIHPDQLDDPARFRADLFAYLDSLPVGELAELPRGATQQPPAAAGLALQRRFGRDDRDLRRWFTIVCTFVSPFILDSGVALQVRLEN